MIPAKPVRDLTNSWLQWPSPPLMRNERDPLRALDVSMLAVPVPEQLALDTLQAPAGVAPVCPSNPSQMISAPQLTGGEEVGGAVVGGLVVAGTLVGGTVVGGAVVGGAPGDGLVPCHAPP